MNNTEALPKPGWYECSFCLRKWKLDSLEFELCPDCFEHLKHFGYLGYDSVKLRMLLKHGEFQDRTMHEVVKLLYNEIQKRALDEVD